MLEAKIDGDAAQRNSGRSRKRLHGPEGRGRPHTLPDQTVSEQMIQTM